MSALGQKRTSLIRSPRRRGQLAWTAHPQELMSALPPKADMCSALDHVCYGPKADIDFIDQVIRRRATSVKTPSFDLAQGLPLHVGDKQRHEEVSYYRAIARHQWTQENALVGKRLLDRFTRDRQIQKHHGRYSSHNHRQAIWYSIPSICSSDICF